MHPPADQATAAQPLFPWHMNHHELEDLIWQGCQTQHGEAQRLELMQETISDHRMNSTDQANG
jgi:hypothetical protein